MNSPYFKLENGILVPIRFTRKLTKSDAYFDDKLHEIAIDTNLRGELFTDRIIHECLHAEEPKWREEVVESLGKRLAALLHTESIFERIIG